MVRVLLVYGKIISSRISKKVKFKKLKKLNEDKTTFSFKAFENHVKKQQILPQNLQLKKYVQVSPDLTFNLENDKRTNKSVSLDKSHSKNH